MAAEPHRSNQPLVNGQSESGSSKGNSDRDTVDGEKDHHPQNSQPTHAPVGPPLHLNWPRQQRPPDPRGLHPQTGARPPPHQGVRRVSPWAVLRTKLPDQQGLRPPGLEHAIYRMQNPEDMMRPRASPDINGFSRPPLGMSRPPSGQLSKPPSLEGPNPPGPTPPRSPFLQRADSRTGSPMFPPMGGPGMMTPPPAGGMSPRPPSLSPRPPIVNRLSREEDEEDVPSSTGLMGSRPGSAARFPTPPLVRTPSGSTAGVGSLPTRPPSRTPPPPTQSPLPGMPTSPNPPRTTPPARQSSVTSLSGQSDHSLKPDNSFETDSIKSSTPSPRPLSAATSQESDNPPQSTDAKPAVKETKPEPTSGEEQHSPNPAKSNKPPNEDSVSKEPPAKDSIANKGDENLKRPTSLETNKKEGHEELRDTPSDSKDAPTLSEGSKETVVNGSHESPKKLPPKGAAPKKLGAVPLAAKSPSKSLPKTPDTPGTSEKKNTTTPDKHPKNVEDSPYESSDRAQKSSKLRVRIKEPEEVLIIRNVRSVQRSASRRDSVSKQRPQRRDSLPKQKPKISLDLTKPIPQPLAENPASEHHHTTTYSTQSTPDYECSSLLPSYEYARSTTDKKTRCKRRGKLYSSFSSFDSGTPERTKLPMNKIQVGAAPSPNLKVVKSKIGSLENAKHKPGGGQVKIESRKLDFKAGSRIENKNDTYTPGGGEKKIQQNKLQWNAKSKIGSLENATHKPGGGDKKIESLKLDFKDKAKPKVGSKDNMKHVPGGGQVKIEDQKLDIKAQSRVGSLDNVKYKPGGGEVKIFDDKEYKKQTMGSMSDVHSASNQSKKESAEGPLKLNGTDKEHLKEGNVRRTSRSSSTSRTRLSGSKSGTRENLTDDLYSPEKPPSKPLAKPTDQNSNQLSRAQNDTADKEESKLNADKNDDVTTAIDNEKPPPQPPKSDGVAALPSNSGEPPSSQHKEDLHAAVIEKSQTEMPEKELAKP